MKNHNESTDKRRFKNDFQSGDLYQKWHDIYYNNDYLSKWARHRMDVALYLIDSYGLGRTGNALDIGIGSGDLLNELSKRGSDVWGADFSIEIIRNNYKRFCSLNDRIVNGFVTSDIETLPFKCDSFELVTCLGVLEYLPTDKIALGELYRIICPGGYLVLAVASYHRFGSLLSLVKNKILKKMLIKSVSSLETSTLYDRIRLVKPLRLRKEMIKAGFEVKEFRCFGGKIFGRYFPIRLYLPGFVYIGDHCISVLKKPF